MQKHSETALETPIFEGALKKDGIAGSFPVKMHLIVQHKEGSKAFARYREIDKDIKRDALKVFEAI